MQWDKSKFQERLRSIKHLLSEFEEALEQADTSNINDLEALDTSTLTEEVDERDSYNVEYFNEMQEAQDEENTRKPYFADFHSGIQVSRFER